MIIIVNVGAINWFSQKTYRDLHKNVRGPTTLDFFAITFFIVVDGAYNIFSFESNLMIDLFIEDANGLALETNVCLEQVVPKVIPK